MHATPTLRTALGLAALLCADALPPLVQQLIHVLCLGKAGVGGIDAVVVAGVQGCKPLILHIDFKGIFLDLFNGVSLPYNC